MFAGESDSQFTMTTTNVIIVNRSHFWVRDNNHVAAATTVPARRPSPRIAKHFKAVTALSTLPTAHADAGLIHKPLVPSPTKARVGLRKRLTSEKHRRENEMEASVGIITGSCPHRPRLNSAHVGSWSGHWSGEGRGSGLDFREPGFCDGGCRIRLSVVDLE